MAKKDIDWGNLGFGYSKTDYRYVSNFKNAVDALEVKVDNNGDVIVDNEQSSGCKASVAFVTLPMLLCMVGVVLVKRKEN